MTDRHNPGFLGTPLIELRGNLAGSASGLVIQGTASTINGLAINGFSGDGINLTAGASYNTYRRQLHWRGRHGNVGFSQRRKWHSRAGRGRRQHHRRRCGRRRNVISGNFNGITLSVGTVVQGNYLGTDASGTLAIPNFNAGVLLANDAESLIGGSGAGAGNLVSGNAVGILINGGLSTRNTRIEGNLIGTAWAARPRWKQSRYSRRGKLSGLCSRRVDWRIGQGAGNVIAGNTSAGIHITGNGAQGVRIENNRIGTNLEGTAAIGNLRGVLVEGGVGGVMIGGPDVGNVISGNQTDGIRIIGNAPNKTQAFVNGDWTPPAWQGWNTFPLPPGPANPLWISASNHTDFDAEGGEAGGILTRSPADPDEVTEPVTYYADEDLGGTLTLRQSIHADGEIVVPAITLFDGRAGIEFFSQAEAQANLDRSALGLRVLGPDAGITGLRAQAALVLADGTVRLGNPVNGTEGLTVGTAYRWLLDYDPAAGSSGNGRIVVDVFAVDGTSLGTSTIDLTPVDRVVGQFDAFGLRNGGGEPASDGSTLSLYVDSVHYSRVVENVIEGNLIGTDRAGMTALVTEWPNDFSGWGIYAADTSNLRIGGSADGARNVISGNVHAVIIEGAVSQNNRVQGNYVGTNIDGAAVLANKSGISIGYAAAFNVVGTDGDGINDDREGNLISGNQLGGVYLHTNANDNVIAGNLIGTDATGLTALASPGGIVVYSSGSRNRIGTDADGVSDELERNVIVSGVSLNVDDRDPNGMFDNVIAGNYIGIDIEGTATFHVGRTGVNLGVVRVAETPGVTGPVGTIIGGMPRSHGTSSPAFRNTALRHLRPSARWSKATTLGPT